MKTYLRILAAFYFLGFSLHILDIFNLRLNYSEMPILWKIWIAYLTVFDLAAAVGLWRKNVWGELAFIAVAISQLIAYIGFKKYFGYQSELIAFHIVTLSTYCVFKAKLHLNVGRNSLT
ncbi:MAG: hypothetical protein JNL11_03415 [Bdellovibrionaceae bacterium]|nr:hypothetical protein [Pseudobdellovibrionaceae bacterium]